MTALAVRGAALVAESEAVLARHGRTFRLASWFLPRAARADAAVLYAYCRGLDDAVDEAPNRGAAVDAVAHSRGELLGTLTSPLTAAALEVFQRRGVPTVVATHLLDGMESDLDPRAIADEAELIRYCYQVAGTVGRMMSGVLGVSDGRATAHAIDLGIGMQLTNIARDVREDLGRARTYLPATWLAERGVTSAALIKQGMIPAHAAAVFPVVKRTLTLAERYYASAMDGMGYIPLRTRFAIVAAGRMYRQIGVRLLRRGPSGLMRREVVPGFVKAGVVASAMLRAPWLRPSDHDSSLHSALAGWLSE